MEIKKLKIAIEQAQKVCNEMNQCANKFILQDAINDMNKALTITDVVVPKDTLCNRNENNFGMCNCCGDNNCHDAFCKG